MRFAGCPSAGGHPYLLPLALFLLIFLAIPAPAYDNLLIITVDTLRADYIGPGSSNRVETPNIDGLAQNGIVFRNTVAPTPLTMPSHASLFSGLIPPNHGVHDNGFRLDSKIMTLAEILKARGMRTAAFIGSFSVDSRFGLDQGFDTYDDSYPSVTNLAAITVSERRAEEVVNAALKWLDTKTEGSWFVWIHLFDPHYPYNPPEDFAKIYPNNPYAGEIAYADKQIGRLVGYLRQKALFEKTLIVLTSDHGESLGDHGEKTHGIFAYESTLRVPLILAPAKQPAVIETRVRLIDVAPTVLQLFGTSVPQRIDGISFVEKMAGRNARPPDPAYFEAISMYLNGHWAPLRGFYSGNYKYISLPVEELYELQKDPGETNNLCKDMDLCNKWAKQFTDFSGPLRSIPQPQIDAESAERLQALGYTSARSGSAQSKRFGAKDDPKTLIYLHDQAYLALSLFNKGNASKAIQTLDSVIAKRPNYSEAYLIKSFIQSTNALPEQAAETMKQALRNGVSGAEIHGKLGLYLQEAKKYSEAIRHLQIALEEDPGDLTYLNFLGIAYAALGNPQQAEIAFRRAVALDSSDSTSLNNLGAHYLKEKKFELAVQNFQAAIAANPYIDNAYKGLAAAHENLMHWNEAIRIWTQVLEKNPKDLDALLHIGYDYLEVSDRKKALKYLEAFVENAPPDKYDRILPKVHSLILQLKE